VSSRKGGICALKRRYHLWHATFGETTNFLRGSPVGGAAGRDNVGNADKIQRRHPARIRQKEGSGRLGRVFRGEYSWDTANRWAQDDAPKIPISGGPSRARADRNDFSVSSSVHSRDRASELATNARTAARLPGSWVEGGARRETLAGLGRHGHPMPRKGSYHPGGLHPWGDRGEIELGGDITIWKRRRNYAFEIIKKQSRIQICENK
jgi:hypothetical protein